jgi:cyclopropane fatty-acyl-phospholipid synthase-like methyltransferase
MDFLIQFFIRLYIIIIQLLLYINRTVNCNTSNQFLQILRTSEYALLLSEKRKIGCSINDVGSSNINKMEHTMLLFYLIKLNIEKEEEVLEIDCEWGFFSLQAAQIYTKASFTCTTDSEDQYTYIKTKIVEKNIPNLKVILVSPTKSLKEYIKGHSFDKIISIESVNQRDHNAIFDDIYHLLKKNGSFMIQVNCHKNTTHNIHGIYFPTYETVKNIHRHLMFLESFPINGENYLIPTKNFKFFQKIKLSFISEIFSFAGGTKYTPTIFLGKKRSY